MKTSVLPGYRNPAIAIEGSLVSVFKSLLDWLEHNRAVVIITSLMIQGNLIVPGTLMLILLFPQSFQWVSISILVSLSFAVLIANLALLPIRFIVKLFLINVLVSVLLVLAHLFS
jgi:hypothetical protein